MELEPPSLSCQAVLCNAYFAPVSAAAVAPNNYEMKSAEAHPETSDVAHVQTNASGASASPAHVHIADSEPPVKKSKTVTSKLEVLPALPVSSDIAPDQATPFTAAADDEEPAFKQARTEVNTPSKTPAAATVHTPESAEQVSTGKGKGKSDKGKGSKSDKDTGKSETAR